MSSLFELLGWLDASLPPSVEDLSTGSFTKAVNMGLECSAQNNDVSMHRHLLFTTHTEITRYAAKWARLCETNILQQINAIVSIKRKDWNTFIENWTIAQHEMLCALTTTAQKNLESPVVVSQTSNLSENTVKELPLSSAQILNSKDHVTYADATNQEKHFQLPSPSSIKSLGVITSNGISECLSNENFQKAAHYNAETNIQQRRLSSPTPIYSQPNFVLEEYQDSSAMYEANSTNSVEIAGKLSSSELQQLGSDEVVCALPTVSPDEEMKVLNKALQSEDPNKALESTSMVSQHAEQRSHVCESRMRIESSLRRRWTMPKHDREVAETTILYGNEQRDNENSYTKKKRQRLAQIEVTNLHRSSSFFQKPLQNCPETIDLRCDEHDRLPDVCKSPSNVSRRVLHGSVRLPLLRRVVLSVSAYSLVQSSAFDFY